MKEQLFEILHNRKRMPGERFSDIEGKIENFVNQEVERRIAETVAGKFIAVEIEKRIAERMPSEEEGRERIPYPQPRNEYQHYQNIGFIRGWKAVIKEFRSRLTSSEKPNNSEGGEG